MIEGHMRKFDAYILFGQFYSQNCIVVKDPLERDHFSTHSVFTMNPQLKNNFLASIPIPLTLHIFVQKG